MHPTGPAQWSAAPARSAETPGRGRATPVGEWGCVWRSLPQPERLAHVQPFPGLCSVHWLAYRCDHVDDVRDVVGHFGLVRRGQAAQELHVAVELLDESGAQVQGVDPSLCRPLQDLQQRGDARGVPIPPSPVQALQARGDSCKARTALAPC